MLLFANENEDDLYALLDADANSEPKSVGMTFISPEEEDIFQTAAENACIAIQIRRTPENKCVVLCDGFLQGILMDYVDLEKRERKSRLST